MTDQVAIANQALGLMGARVTIQNFNQGTPESNACALFFTPQFQSLARSANWNCLRRQEPLTLLKAAPWTPEGQSQTYPMPPIPWAYEYAIPPDCLRARFVVPFNVQQQAATSPPLMTNVPPPIPWVGGRQAVKFVVSSDTNAQGSLIKVLLTNKPQAQLVYTGDLEDPDLWDSMFSWAFSNTLAAFLVNVLGRNAALMKDLISVANGLIAQARQMDGDEGITSADHLPDWIRGRFASGLNGGFDGGSGGNWEAYDSMCWPNASMY